MKKQTERKKNIESKRALLQRLFLIPNKYCLRENETGTSQILMNRADDKRKYILIIKYSTEEQGRLVYSLS
jgi:hypothetical protein